MTSIDDRGLTTDNVHADRRFGVEHGGIHKPIHTSVQYGHERVEDLIGVFQGTLKGGFNYARQGTPTTAALETKITQLEQGPGNTRRLVIPVAPTIFWEAGAAAQAEMGIGNRLIRPSIGLEDRAD